MISLIHQGSGPLHYLTLSINPLCIFIWIIRLKKFIYTFYVWYFLLSIYAHFIRKSSFGWFGIPWNKCWGFIDNPIIKLLRKSYLETILIIGNIMSRIPQLIIWTDILNSSLFSYKVSQLENYVQVRQSDFKYYSYSLYGINYFNGHK